MIKWHINKLFGILNFRLSTVRTFNFNAVVWRASIFNITESMYVNSCLKSKMLNREYPSCNFCLSGADWLNFWIIRKCIYAVKWIALFYIGVPGLFYSNISYTISMFFSPFFFLASTSQFHFVSCDEREFLTVQIDFNRLNVCFWVFFPFMKHIMNWI